MSDDSVEVEIYGRKLTLTLEGFSPLQINAIAQRVDGLMKDISRNQKIVDSSKLAVMTAIEISAELELMKAKLDAFEKIEGGKVDGMILDLEKSLGPE